jgi:hypothetical protein
MEKEQRSRLQKATQDARKLLEEEFRSQLLQTYDIDVEKVRVAKEPGAHLQAEQRLIREKLIAWIEHKEAQINDRKEALLLALREMAFTALNRFVALKLMEARELVRPCVSGGLESAGFLEFTAVAQGLLADQESSYRLYLETIFEDVSRELRALFDPRDPASLLWPKRTALLELLDILNRPELAELWGEDETLGWVYQYFNGDAERKKMREESAAPRNSRELAVRNQFFTPRYVVEFLTDNTLGRIWYEMRQSNTGLKDRCRYLVRRPNEIWLQPGEEPPAQPDADEALSQEELLHQPVYIPHRPLKDPREIRMLDPACGSMHFGLYAFDLYLEIYKEAWEIAQGSDGQSKQEEAFSPFVAYAAGFSDKSAFLREVPRLILQHNIHGIDIDPRATQIARLTLWLRAQRAWQERKVEVISRPAITRSNVVCAEPMPGERELLADFVDEQFPEAERGLAQQLLEAIFDKMELAGEAGSLLRIEEEIRDAIDQARREWQKLAIQQRDLFSAAELDALGGAGSALSTDLQNLTKSFWINIEERIYAALRSYSEQAETEGFRRQLFAEDASQGFAFIDVCRKRFDIALMNPPFGSPSRPGKSEIKRLYADSWKDLYAAFAERMHGMVHDLDGLLGAITPTAWMFSRQLRDFRINLIGDGLLSNFAELGSGVMDSAVVEACIWTATSLTRSSHRLNVLDLTSADSSQRSNLLLPANPQWKTIGRERFKDIEDMPFCYYADPEILRRWQNPERLQPSAATILKGNATWDDFRFLRLWFEVPSGDDAWRTYKTGGDYEPFAECSSLVMNWNRSGEEIRQNAIQHSGSDAQTMQSSRYWFLAGLSLPFMGGEIGVRASRAGEVISQTVVFINCIQQELAVPLLGILNAPCLNSFYEVRGRRRHKDTIIFKDLPITRADIIALSPVIAPLVNRAIACADLANRIDETQRLYAGHDSCLERINFFADTIKELDRSIADNTIAIDGLVADFFGLPTLGADQENNKLPAPTRDLPSTTALITSLCIGIAYGRWDPDFTQKWCVNLDGNQVDNSSSQEAFDELPRNPPAYLEFDVIPVGDSLSASSTRNNPIKESVIPQGIACSERLTDAIATIAKWLWGAEAENFLDSVEKSNGSLQLYLSEPAGFFGEHLKRYSKNRRHAPIYWQLSIGNCGYSVWLYYHCFTQDTLYRVLDSFVEPRIQEAEREQFDLESQGSLSGEAANRLQETQTLLQGLRLFKSELDLVAPLWNPNLNDGVIINHAILWRITPYTPWQKKCKECWDKLVKGDYDWAHLAFHLWPERVIPKCTTDRSLAIAHGLNERLWQETNNGNWLPRQLSEVDLQALISEHSNPAVKSALERFLAAPPPVAPTRTRASRSTRASGSSTPRRARGSAAVVDAEATRQLLHVLTVAPEEGLSKNAIAAALEVEPGSLTAVIKQLKKRGQIEQLGAAKGTKYRLTEQGRAAVASQAGEDD